MRCLVVGGGKRTLDDFFPAKKAQDVRWEVVRGLEELFSAVLERFLEPIHALHVYCKN
jgi:hypothetical protein